VIRNADRLRRGARVLALLAATALLVLAARRLDLGRVATELAGVRPQWLALALLCYVSILPLWAVQWCLLAPAPRPSFARMLGVIGMTSTVLNTTPMLVGEAAGVVFLVTRAGLARGAALSVLAMDQLLVGMAKLTVLAAAAWALELPAWMQRGMTALAVMVGGLLVTLKVLAWREEAIARHAARVLPPRLARGAASIGAALAPLRSPARGGGALLLALAKKSFEMLAILCIQRAFGLSLPVASAILVLAALNLATLVPVVPGNVGVYEAAVVVAYSPFGVGAEQALGMAVVQHGCYFAALALPGYRWLALRARSVAAAP
jgi:uncharacterized membrane protein YbhN (UPF0104 family)